MKGYVPYLEARTGAGYLVQVVVGNEVNSPTVYHGVLAYSLDSEVFGVGNTRHLPVVARRTAVGNSRALNVFFARNGIYISVLGVVGQSRKRGRVAVIEIAVVIGFHPVEQTYRNRAVLLGQLLNSVFLALGIVRIASVVEYVAYRAVGFAAEGLAVKFGFAGLDVLAYILFDEPVGSILIYIIQDVVLGLVRNVDNQRAVFERAVVFVRADSVGVLEMREIGRSHV